MLKSIADPFRRGEKVRTAVQLGTLPKTSLEEQDRSFAACATIPVTSHCRCCCKTPSITLPLEKGEKK